MTVDGLYEDCSFMKKNLGFMQGRLLKPVKKKIIQYFPDKEWFKELEIGQNIFNFIEWTINIENINKNPLIKKKLNKKFLKKLNLVNITVQSVTCDFFMQVPIFKKKYFDQYKKILKYLVQLITNCERLGIKFIVLPLVDNSSIKNLEEEKYLKKLIINLKSKLKKTKIIFETDYPPEEVLRFIKYFNLEKFGINYDTGNSASLGYDFEEEKKYFKYVKNIHIKDRKFKGVSVRLGMGNYNFKKFFNFLKKINYKGNLILQTARSKNNSDIYEICINKNYIETFL